MAWAKICSDVIAMNGFTPKWSLNQIQMESVHETGGRLNKKDGLTRYGDSHVKDKTS